jgi:site-specific recombinase XerD
MAWPHHKVPSTLLRRLHLISLIHRESFRASVLHLSELPVVLSSEQVSRLLAEPEEDTVIGLRDRALLALLYGTGIRASECSSLCNGQVDLSQLTIRVRGKGGHERAPARDRQRRASVR